MEERKWFVGNDKGEIACHDCDEESARIVLEIRQKEEPDAGWEMMKED